MSEAVLVPVTRNKSLDRNIGEVITSLIPLDDAGLHLLDGTKLSGSGIYEGFIIILMIYTKMRK